MDTMSDKTLRISLVIVSLFFIWVTVLLGKKTNQYNKQEIVIKDLKKQMDTLEFQKDSMYWELFPIQNELGRYEIALEILRERNPKAANQYGTIISQETE